MGLLIGASVITLFEAFDAFVSTVARRTLKGTLSWRHIFPYVSVVSSAARAACPNPTCGPPLAGACVLRQSATRTSFQSSQFAKFLEIVNNLRLFCRVVELPYIVDFFIKM